jgi:hypothetical protein
MKTKLTARNTQRGSALLASMIIVMVLSFAAGAILDYSLTTYRNSMRQLLLDTAKHIADSEMEYEYYTWKNCLLNDKVAPENLHGDANMSSVATSFSSGGVTGTPLSQDVQTSTAGQSANWAVTRYLDFNPVGTGDGGAEGVSNGIVGKNYYFTAKISATLNSPLFGTVVYNTGRHFAYSSTPLFQYAVFYQGNLEMAAGGNMTIGGPVSTNASAYLGAGANLADPGHPFVLQLASTVSFFQDYNGASDPLTGETDLLEGSTALVDPIYNPDTTPDSTPPADQAAQRQIQVQKMSAQANFIGGVDVQADVAPGSPYAAAYTNLQGQVDPNEIYRAVVAPPPQTSDGSALLAEDPLVAASRMYNTAGILITIEPDPANPGQSKVLVGRADTPDHGGAGTGNNDNSLSTEPDLTSIVNPGTTANPVITTVRAGVIDPREELGGASHVNMTTIDIGNLNIALHNLAVNDPSKFGADYNGVVYVYDKTANTDGSLNAVRLVNATTTPNFPDSAGNPLGFTVVSDNGVYVQGDWNTTQYNFPGVTGLQNNPTGIMGDAVTVLSSAWSLANNSDTNPLGPITTGTDNRQAAASGPVPWSGGNVTSPINPASAGTANGMTVNAAILTGNTPSTTTTNSGGAQNLVRMIEDWYYADGGNLSLTLDGSLGQLFTSKYFVGAFKNGQQAGLGTVPTGGYNQVYIQPPHRYFNFDQGFKERTPAGAPTLTGFTRGDFFFWQ